MNIHRSRLGFTLLECLASLILILLLLGTLFSVNVKIGEEKRTAEFVERLIQLVTQNSKAQPQQIFTLKILNDGERARLEMDGDEIYQLPQGYTISDAIDPIPAIMVLRFQNGRKLFHQMLYLIKSDTRTVVRQW